MNGWINFKELRAKLDFEQVLRHFGVEVKRKGKQHHGFCPLPNHNGKKNSPSFSANLERGIFQCFGCGAKGNLLEFAAMMRNVDLGDGTAIREVAFELQKQFCSELGSASQEKKKPVEQNQPTAKTTEDQSPMINAPLDFELKDLDREHPYLRGRRFLPETIAHFGLGYCSRGMLKGRIAIPLQDHAGQLIGYAGRVVDDSTISEDNPRYRFPGERKRDGKIVEFRKTLFLYNGFRIKAPVDDLIIVEGFTGVWWLHQNGFHHVVATMGSDCSERQAELIVFQVRPGGRVWIIPDGDAAGERFAESLLRQISPVRFVRWVNVSTGSQPTDLDPKQLRALIYL